MSPISQAESGEGLEKCTTAPGIQHRPGCARRPLECLAKMTRQR